MYIYIYIYTVGDAVNYSIGNALGPKAFESDTWFLKKKNLKKVLQGPPYTHTYMSPIFPYIHTHIYT